MSRFCFSRGYMRLASVFYSADIDALKSLFIALHGSPVGEDEDVCVVAYRKAFKEVACALGDETFVRLASVAEDVLDWSADEEEWERYVRSGWLVLADEIEFERERIEEELEGLDDWRYWWRNAGYTRDEARATAKTDMRRWK